MQRSYICNCSKCRKKREMVKVKKQCNTSIQTQHTNCRPKRKRRKCYNKNVSCKATNQLNCNCKNNSNLNPLFWIFALLLI